MEKKRGRPRETWRRSVEREVKEKGWSWGQVVKLAKDTQHWRSLVTRLMSGNASRGLRERECPRPRDQVDC